MDLIVILPISMAEFYIVLRYAMFDLIFRDQRRHLIGRKPGMFDWASSKVSAGFL